MKQVFNLSPNQSADRFFPHTDIPWQNENLTLWSLYLLPIGLILCMRSELVLFSITRREEGALTE